MSELIEKINKILHDNIDIWDENEGVDLKNVASEIAAMLDAERKPDTITIPDAVKRLVEFFSEWDIFAAAEIEEEREIDFSWWITMDKRGMSSAPGYVMAIHNGETPAAVTVALEDMFITILTED